MREERRLEKMILNLKAISKSAGLAGVGLATVLGFSSGSFAQAAPGAAAQAPAAAGPNGPIQQLAGADPFPAVNPKFFTAVTPTVDTVNSFLKALWGFDANRIWRVEAIQGTRATGVSKVTVFVSDRSPNAKVQSTSFFVLPDGKFAISDGVVPFGAAPFAETRAILQARADGAARGPASKELLLVEFADLQCPHCKEVQGTMDQLAKDFPKARIVYQSFPLVEIHPAAFQAAAYGVCVTKKSNEAFFKYAAAVFETQEALTPESTNETLKNAVVKAGLDPAAIAACASTQATKDNVNASVKLAEDIGVDQTPMVAVNGHLLPMAQVSYEMLKQIVAYQAQLDGVK